MPADAAQATGQGSHEAKALRILKSFKELKAGLELEQATLILSGARLEGAVQQSHDHLLALDDQHRELGAQINALQTSAAKARDETAWLEKVSSSLKGLLPQASQEEAVFESEEDDPEDSASDGSDNEEYVPPETDEAAPSHNWIKRCRLQGRRGWKCEACDVWLSTEGKKDRHALSTLHRTLAQD